MIKIKVFNISITCIIKLNLILEIDSIRIKIDVRSTAVTGTLINSAFKRKSKGMGNTTKQANKKSLNLIFDTNSILKFTRVHELNG